MAGDAAEVELRDAGVQPLESRRLAQLDAALLNRLGDALDLWVSRNPLVVSVLLVDVACVRTHQPLLERPQISLGLDEAQEYGFQARGTGVILLVRIWGRGNDRIHRTGLQYIQDMPRVGV